MQKNELKISLFSGLNEEQIQKLYSAAKEITLHTGDTLFSETEKSDSLFLILSGSVSVRKAHKTTGKIYEVSTLTKNNTIGEMTLIEEEPR